MAEENEQPTTPMNPTTAFLRERFPEDLLDVSEHRGETTLRVRPAAIAQVCAALRDAPALRYDFLADITAVDWPDRQPRFDLVYHVLSLRTRALVRLKAQVGEDGEEHPEVPTVTGVWLTANWYEREIFDLFGIIFTGHPKLQRILMPNDWVGHPLRKDYPLTGITLPEPHWGGQVPFNQPVPPGFGQHTLRTPGGINERAAFRPVVEGERLDPAENAPAERAEGIPGMEPRSHGE